jgi:very-short-patch-repair endonuclease
MRTVVDFFWPDARLVVELEGCEYQRPGAVVARARVREVALRRAGYEVIRLTERRLRDHPEAVANMIRFLIARGPPPTRRVSQND